MVKDWQNEWFTAEDLLHMGDTQRQPESIDSLCPEGQGVLILGPESCLKSSTAVELAVAMSTGEENDTKPAKNVVKNISSYHKSRHFLIHHRSKPGNEPRTLGEMARGSAVLGR
jgi:hypothetical protein